MSPSPASRQQEQLAGLSARYRTVLQRYFERRVPVRSDIEDLIQEVFIRLLRASSLDEVNHLEGYLFQVAANVLHDRGRYRRSRNTDRHEPYEEPVHALEDFSPERVLMGKQAVSRVAQALHELPERVRVAFVLHRFEGLRHPEIGKRLGVSVSAVEKYIMQALVHIRRRLDE